ncbi:zinc ABC transporter substrate-binding protein [bacterium]|nr:zinc ABC transporter substrate-binding protein [bacterium]
MIILLLVSVSCSSKQSNSHKYVSNNDTQKPCVFVSILPMKYFVERIAGECFDVQVLVGPGQSPATYEPTPRQMAKLNDAVVYFRIGVPFENVWLNRIANANPDMQVVDTRKDIELREISRHGHDKDSGAHEGNKDPHIWLSPSLVKYQARTICDALIEIAPAQRDEFDDGLTGFIEDLDNLSLEIKNTLSELKSRKFMVFHPSWGYFADEFNLEQIPIEIEGKEPGAKELSDIIDYAKKQNIKVIFTQAQFSQKSAKAIASQFNGKVIAIDPLDEDYINNLRKVANLFAGEIK